MIIVYIIVGKGDWLLGGVAEAWWGEVDDVEFDYWE